MIKVKVNVLADRGNSIVKFGLCHNMSSVVCDTSVLWQNGWGKDHAVFAEQ